MKPRVPKYWLRSTQWMFRPRTMEDHINFWVKHVRVVTVPGKTTATPLPLVLITGEHSFTHDDLKRMFPWTRKS